MPKRSFESIISHLKTSIADYQYYVSFDKVHKNSMVNYDNLAILNQLIGSKNIEQDFTEMVEKFPAIIDSIPSLLAIRNKKIPILDQTLIEYEFNSKTPMATKDYLRFMRKTGLFDLLENERIHDLRDYYFGVEVGMDTNGRKNRTGITMEKLVEDYIMAAKPDRYYSQMSKKEVLKEFNIDLTKLMINNKTNKEAEKRFDFVIKHKKDLYLVETNFYGSGGSKLNETARSFKSLAQSLDVLPNLHFVWITDGIGWRSAQGNLREAYNLINYFYTLTDLESGVLKEICK